jgi:hypothetical protein
MLARLAPSLPGGDWVYEPKWGWISGAADPARLSRKGLVPQRASP